MDTTQTIPIQYLLLGGNASVKTSTSWHKIDWGKVTLVVKSLQQRIAQAIRQGKWHKSKRLQGLLSHCYAAKLLAIRRVTQNKGKRTAGVDGCTWRTAKDKLNAIAGLQLKGYKSSPLRRVNIPKGNGKTRPLGIPTMRDRAMQALYLLSLEPISETTGDWNSYGFRPHRSCADAIGSCFVRLSRRTSPQWILEGDIKGCFDNISHEWIEQHIPLPKKLLKEWLQAGYVEKGRLYPTKSGTPQGGIISPTIANMVLDGLESHIDKACDLKRMGEKTTRRHNTRQIYFVRYADDFIVTSTDREYLEQVVKPAIQTFLASRGLELSEEKTRISHIEQGFDFLGQNIRRFKGGLLIRPAKKSITNFLKKVKMVIDKQKEVTPQTLIRTLNPMIKGWAMYHRHVVSKRIFSRLDHEIFKKIWSWCKRKHRGRWKSMKWLKKRYFTAIQGRNWLFYDKVVDKRDKTDKNKSSKILLCQASAIRIKRHIKIRCNANPYLLEQEPYFESRIQRAMLQKSDTQKQLTEIYGRQKGKCAYCHQPISIASGWHIHHKVYRVNGGKNTTDNLVLLHPDCHKSVHATGFSFA